VIKHKSRHNGRPSRFEDACRRPSNRNLEGSSPIVNSYPAVRLRIEYFLRQFWRGDIGAKARIIGLLEALIQQGRKAVPSALPSQMRG
jgi:hypothetical protein